MKITLGIAGVLVVMAAGIAILLNTDDGDTADGGNVQEARHPTASPRSAAAILPCPGARGVRASFEEAAGEFTLVGTLEQVDGGYFTVESPGRDVELVLAGDSQVEGQYSLGDAIRVEGRVGAGTRLEAVNVRPACGLVADVPAGTPVASTTVAAETSTPALAPTPRLVPVLPVFQPQEPEDAPVEEAPVETETPAPVATDPAPEPTAAPTEPPPTEEPRPSRTAAAPEETPVTE